MKVRITDTSQNPRVVSRGELVEGIIYKTRAGAYAMKAYRNIVYVFPGSDKPLTVYPIDLRNVGEGVNEFLEQPEGTQIILEQGRN